jgi:hypothetical protein
MHFCKFFHLFIFAKYTLTLKHLPLSRNLKNASSIKSRAHYTENELPNFDEYIIAMEANEWEEDDVKEFAKLVKQSERAWKPIREELKAINVGTGQDEREFKIGTLMCLLSLVQIRPV